MFILVISVSYHDSSIVISIVLRSPRQHPAVKFSNTKEHSCALFPTFSFCVSSVWVGPGKWKSAPKFQISFRCYGSYIIVFGNIKINWKRNYELNCFYSICQLNYQYNEMWCTNITQIVHSNFHLFLHFQWTLLNIAIYITIWIVFLCFII